MDAEVEEDHLGRIGSGQGRTAETADELLGQSEVSAAADGQELGQALKGPQQHRLQPGHEGTHRKRKITWPMMLA